MTRFERELSGALGAYWKASAEKELGESGRVLVRVSGTEPLVRVMLEGRDKDMIQTLAEEIAQVVKERLI